MLPVLSNLKSFFQSKSVKTDSIVFRLHYRLTVLFLLASSILMTTRQYFADPIYCQASTDSELYSQSMVDKYCWIHQTYVVPEAYTRPDAIHKGIDNAPKGTPRIYQGYYQWVHIVLFIQAILFYLPHLFWKIFEKDRLSKIIDDLKMTLIDPEVADKSYETLANYLKSSSGANHFYSWSYVVCESINVFNAIGQIYLMDAFLGGEFSTYGVQVIQFLQLIPEERSDPMSKIFPKVTKCDFFKYGPSGDRQSHDVLCILPHNILNEKIYVFFWFWLVILACLSILQLIYRGVILFSSRFRLWVIKINHYHVNTHVMDAVVFNLSFSDWYLLYLVGENIDYLHFRGLAEELFRKMFMMDQKEEKIETRSEDEEKTPVLIPKELQHYQTKEKPHPPTPPRIPLATLPPVYLRPTYTSHK